MAKSISLWVLIIFIQAVSASQTCPQCSAYTCRRISGIYTVTVLRSGTYNSVVEIPATACSINITELTRSDNYLALSTKEGDGIINSKWALGQPGQYYGAGARFSYARNSNNCRGSCIQSPGPTTDDVLVQILYYNKNPGIAYEFTIPNTVEFNPLEGISPTSTSIPTAIPSERTLPKIRFAPRVPGSASTRHPGRSRSNLYGQETSRELHNRRVGEDAESLREYHPDPQAARLEGRPDKTSAADGGPPPQELTIGTSYGSHTLGGRGLSYTYGGTESIGSPFTARSTAKRQHSRGTRHRKPRHNGVERYISGSSTSRTVRPRYVSAVRQHDIPRRRGRKSNYVRTPRYQSFSERATSYRDNSADPSDRYSRYNRGSLSSEKTKQYRWSISGFSECTHTCGGGFQSTNIVCVSLGGRTQVVVTAENCASYRKPQQQTVVCNKSPCSPAWETDPWSECSVTCGSGTQVRKVECRQRFSSTLTLKVSADECGMENKPAVAQQCNTGMCSRWSVGPWSECEECGSGENRREVRCVDMSESPIPDKFCREVRPASIQQCHNKPCTAAWWLSEWSHECSASCGEGTQTRRALCVDGHGSISSDKLCEKLEQPILEKQCTTDIACSGSWFTGNWGKCSTGCGEGIRTRHVVCLQRTASSKGNHLSVIDDSDCDLTSKPDSQQPCSRANCNAMWFTGPWGQCSVTCGDGYISREVRCIIDDKSSEASHKSSTVTLTESARCVASSRPDTRKVCSQGTCPLKPHYQRSDRYEPSRYDSRVLRENENQSYTSAASGHFSGGTRRYKPVKTTPDMDEESYSERRDESRDHPLSKQKKLDERDRRTERKHHHYGKSCSDKGKRRCVMVVQARLCSYPYYQQVCCQSCRKHQLKH